jgi:hypothetical protein
VPSLCPRWRHPSTTMTTCPVLARRPDSRSPRSYSARGLSDLAT